MLIHWTFDPILFSAGPLAIRWYGLLFVGAFLVGQWMLGRIFAAEGVPRENAERLMIHALLGAVIGARLVHCLFYEPGYYLSHPLAILRIWEGGLASHGGALGMLLALWFAARTTRPGLPFLWLIDRVSMPAALGAVFVRVANFLNSEIVGIPTSGRWGVVFESVDALPRHPAQLYEAIAYALIFVVLWAIYRRSGKRTPEGLLFGVLMALVFSARILVEFFKTPQAAYEAGQSFSVGQYLSLPFVMMGVVMVMRAMRRSPRP
ncbi:MAG: prolipoprotein diacylglyceryl transferase [Lysobacter sp.]|nr:prolipoprotein diacylglyceryl transferase [Lysobacter sp.]